MQDDLLPLFLSEADERLDRLETILRGESEDWDVVRRELHTLKGACRMMGLTDIAAACHHAEDRVSGAPSEEDRIALGDTLQDIRRLIERLGRGNSDRNDSNGTPAAEESGPRPHIEGSADVRISGDVLDRISDQAVRLSFLSRAIETIVEDLITLARTAEQGISDRHPEQVLAILAHRIRELGLRGDSGRNRFERLIEQQVSTLLSLQVQPIKPILTGLARHGEELARSLGKKVDVLVKTSRSRLDRRITSAIKDSLLHLVRNAVDHGIETPEDRVRAGKNPVGTIILEAETRTERVRITVSDDGAGIDPGGVAERAVRHAMISQSVAKSMSPDAVLQLLFRPGFSTREQTDAISGRGIGLDSVGAAVRGVGGTVWAESDPGAGFRVVLDLPPSRRGEIITVIRVGETLLGIPSHRIRGFERDVSSGELTLHADGGGFQVDLGIDEIGGDEEVFVHPWPKFSGAVPGFEGMALLADGRPIAVLDVRNPGEFGTGIDHRYPGEAEERSLRPNILLVDDSRITRDLFRRMLQEAEFTVVSVSSGDAALSVLADDEIDCIVTDIEMPGMDGFELTRRIRSDSRWEHLPVVVVSTRDTAQDRRNGLEAGADAYHIKQGLQERELVTMIKRLCGRLDGSASPMGEGEQNRGGEHR